MYVPFVSSPALVYAPYGERLQTDATCDQHRMSITCVPPETMSFYPPESNERVG
jgi:hypothetical protein